MSWGFLVFCLSIITREMQEHLFIDFKKKKKKNEFGLEEKKTVVEKSEN